MAASDDSPSGTQGESVFRRVLVALDSSAASDAMLELAAALAAANACELRGLYVEDQDLLHLAELPFAREVQISQAISRALRREQLLQDLRAQAGVARAAMMHQAARHRIAWSFQVTQGRTDEAVLLAAAAGDIIAMARRFGPLGQASGFGRRVRLIAERAPGPLLLAGEPPAGLPGPILLPYDGSLPTQRLLPIAVALARARDAMLEIVLLGETAERLPETQAELGARAGRERLRGLRLWVPRDRGAALRRLTEADRGLIVLPADAPAWAAGEVEVILERARLPIVLQAQGPGAGA